MTGRPDALSAVVVTLLFLVLLFLFGWCASAQNWFAAAPAAVGMLNLFITMAICGPANLRSIP